MNKLICRLALVLAAASLAGCGLKGPLYFPKDEATQPHTTTATATQDSATSAGQRAQAAQ